MSTADTLSVISLVSFILSGIFFAVSVTLWFVLRIPSVIGDLSGRTAKKSIEKMRQSNQKAGNIASKASAKPVQGSMNRIGDSAAVPAEATPNIENNIRPETGLLSENKAIGVPTTPTEMLTDDATGILTEPDATMPLTDAAAKPVKRTGGKKLIMLDEVMFVHTNEEVIG